VRNALAVAQKAGASGSCFAPKEGQIYRSINHMGTMMEYTNFSLWDGSRKYEKSLIAKEFIFYPWKSLHEGLNLKTYLPGLANLAPIDLSKKSIHIGSILGTNSFQTSNTTVDMAFYLYGHVAPCKEDIYAFGGAFGYGSNGNFKNPVTTSLQCPANYQGQEFIGTNNKDWVAFSCSRKVSSDDEAQWYFGGFFGGYWNGTASVNYPNPATGSVGCPSGYKTTSIYGTSYLDYNINVCTRAHAKGVKEALRYGGMYSLGTGFNTKPNPVTGSTTCPDGYTASKILGTANLDADVYVCHKKP
jgi:hypothetical protein